MVTDINMNELPPDQTFTGSFSKMMTISFPLKEGLKLK